MSVVQLFGEQMAAIGQFHVRHYHPFPAAERCCQFVKCSTKWKDECFFLHKLQQMGGGMHLKPVSYPINSAAKN